MTAIEAQMDKELVEPFMPEYKSIISEAKKRIRRRFEK